MQYIFSPYTTLASLLIALIAGVWLFIKLSAWKPLDRFAAAATPLALLTTSGLVLNSILSAPFWSWNSTRLISSFALAYGYPLYHSMDEGPIVTSIYTPLSALVYLPATWFNTPTLAVIVGELIGVCFFFLPILWLHLAGNLNNIHRLLWSIAAFFCFFFITLNSSALNYSAFTVHADAPALGLGAAACAVLYHRKHKKRLLPLLISATLAVLAVLTKQLALPLLIALPAYILLAEGRHSFFNYILCICAAIVAISIPILLSFDRQLMFLNIIVVPGSQPWNPVPGIGGAFAKIFKFISAARDIPTLFLLPTTGVTFYLFYQFPVLIRLKKLRLWVDANRWIILVSVGVCMIPTAVLGKIKVGGALNNYSFVGYFLTAAFTLILLELATGILPSHQQSPEKIVASKNSKLLICILVAILIIHYASSLRFIATNWRNLPNNPEQIVYDYTKSHPGEVYFPWYSLATVMAERKLYHHPMGMQDREWANFSISDEHFRSHIPTKLKLVAFYKQDPGNNPMPYLPNFNRLFLHPLVNTLETVVLKYLPEFSKSVKIEELPGWIVYQKE